MTTGEMRERVFRRMLVRQAGPGADASAVAAATRRLSERFSHRIAPLLGDSGVAAIYARSLHLVQRQIPALVPVGLSERADGPFTLAQHFLEHQEPVVAAEAAVAVLTTVADVLASF